MTNWSCHERRHLGWLDAHLHRFPLTPLLLLATLALGVIGLASLAREEEPQISVPMVDIHVQADGLRAADAVELVTKPLEEIVKGIDGVEHVYSQSNDDRVLITARFLVGTEQDAAMLRVHERIRANMGRIPIGIPEPLIVGRGIDDVAIMVLTLHPTADVAERWDDNALYKVARDIQTELNKVSEVGLTYIVGGRPDQIRVEPDPERLALLGVTLNQLVEKVQNANRAFVAGALREGNRHVEALAGQTLEGVPDIGLLLLTTRDGRPVYVGDVADIVVGSAPTEHRAWHLTPAADGSLDPVPAASLAIAKRSGANAVLVADGILQRLDHLHASVIPDGIEIAVTRNYGQTAQAKADNLLTKIGLVTLSIWLMITLVVGWREGIVVLVVVPATILLTLFASWLMGYTINRVSLFALIFAIGILVDDAIVVVENIVRHWAMDDGRTRVQAAIEAVAEVGNPTIIATLTVVAALLPMMFVSGLMGPYMSPIPANASVAMVFSYFIAVIITPWLMLRLSGRRGAVHGHGDAEGGWLGRAYAAVARPMLRGRLRSVLLLIAVGILTIAAMVPFATRHVMVKLLPFDDKSELQVVIDLPDGANLESTERVLMAAAGRLSDLPELAHIQAYAGTAAPFNFNGLVRHYYLRQSPELGDLQINLHDARTRESHDVALDVRRRLEGLNSPAGTVVRVVEIPPGPPVMATLLAEIYGPDAETRRATASGVREVFEAVEFVVDVDDSFGQPGQRLRFALNQDALEFHGVEEEAVYDTLAALLGGVSVGYSHRGAGIYPVEIAIRLPRQALHVSERLLATPVPGARGTVELGDLVALDMEAASYPLFRRNGRFAEMVMGELAGEYEAPIYGMLEVGSRLGEVAWQDTGPPQIRYVGQPFDETRPTLLWDGEWEVTYITFRDMGRPSWLHCSASISWSSASSAASRCRS
jgi:multidrug efflux pump subunit AcrB